MARQAQRGARNELGRGALSLSSARERGRGGGKVGAPRKTRRSRTRLTSEAFMARASAWPDAQACEMKQWKAFFSGRAGAWTEALSYCQKSIDLRRSAAAAAKITTVMPATTAPAAMMSRLVMNASASVVSSSSSLRPKVP